MERLRICFQKKGAKELIKYNGLYYLQDSKGSHKISEREAVREYLDPESFGQIARPQEVFPNMVHLVDMKWTESKSVMSFVASTVKFTITVDATIDRATVSITEGKLWPRPKRGIKH